MKLSTMFLTVRRNTVQLRARHRAMNSQQCKDEQDNWSVQLTVLVHPQSQKLRLVFFK